MNEPTIRTFSCGAGVQSTAIALLMREGKLPLVDHVIFADTGWEPSAVYAQVDRLAVVFAELGIPLHRVSQGNLRADAINPEHRFASVPYFVRNHDGSEGMGRRQCTSEYKLAPINRKVRELLGAKPPTFRSVPRGRVAETWIGFSTDEIGRVGSAGHQVLYQRPRHPLLELGMSRRDCARYLERAGWGHTVKSACIGCPFHGNRQWRELRDLCRNCGHHRDDHWRGIPGLPAARDPQVVVEAGHLSCAKIVKRLDDGPDPGVETCACPRFDDSEWVDAVEFDRLIRKGGARGLPLNGEAFLHRSRIPLSIAPIDRWTRGDKAEAQAAVQGDLFDELEDGDPDGCSPYGCRSGSAA